MWKRTQMPTSKKSQKSSAVIHLQCWNGCESLGYTKKKSTFYKEQAPKQGDEYLEKIKDIPKEKLVYIDETCISNSKAALILSNQTNYTHQNYTKKYRLTETVVNAVEKMSGVSFGVHD